MSTYILDQTWELEAERLRFLEEAADPITTDHLTRIGVGAGWRCLEVGAGRGSMAAWLADRVGPAGSVLAVDLDVTLLEQHERENLEVRQLDIFSGALPERTFDLVHARHVIGHLGERRQEAIGILVSALKPGGQLVVEDFDFVWNQLDEWPSSNPELGALFLKLYRGIAAIAKAGNYDSNWGRHLPSAMIEAGLVDVRGELRAPIEGRVGANIARLMLLRFREPLAMLQAMTAEELDRLLELTSNLDDNTVVMAPLAASVWGRRP